LPNRRNLINCSFSSILDTWYEIWYNSQQKSKINLQQRHRCLV